MRILQLISPWRPLLYTQLTEFVREVANIMSGGSNCHPVICDDCLKRGQSLGNRPTSDVIDDVSDIADILSESGFASESTSESADDDDDDVSQLRLLVEITTGKRILEVGQPHEMKQIGGIPLGIKRSKRRKKHHHKTHKSGKRTAKAESDRKSAKVERKFTEIELKSAKPSTKRNVKSS